MCNYCKQIDYCGDSLPTSKHIDGSSQNIDCYIFDSPEDESFVLNINGDYIDIRIDIKYCPICGEIL